MTKNEAIKLFGENATSSDLARALGITPQAVHVWPQILTQRQEDEVRGAALRLGTVKCPCVQAPQAAA